MYDFRPLPCIFIAKIKQCSEGGLVIISFNRFIGFIQIIFGLALSFADGTEGGRGGKCTNLSHFLAFS